MVGVRRAIVIALAAPVLGAVLLAGSAYLPAAPIAKNVGASAVVLHEEGRWPSVPALYGFRRGDNWTDATILNISMIDQRGGAVRSTLMGYQYVVYDEDSRHDPPRALLERTQRGAPPNEAYERYWHGYVTVTRPLLTVFDYTQLRVLSTVFLAGLAGGALYQLQRRLGVSAAVVFALSVVPMGALAISSSLTYKTTLVIACVGILSVLHLHEERPLGVWLLPVCAGLGTSTAYFDLLTTPLLTVGLPLVALAALQLSRGERVSVGVMAAAIVTWATAYVSMWASKWLLLQLVFGSGLADALGKIVERTGGVGAEGYVDRLSPIASNLRFLGPGRFAHGNVSAQAEVQVLVAVLGLAALTWWMLHRFTGTSARQSRAALPLLLFAGAPYAWYLFAANHSYIHAWFTFRLQYLTLVAVGLFFLYSFDWSVIARRVSHR